MSVKKRKYSEDYLQYGFTDAMVNDQVVPQCVISFQILSNNALQPTRLHWLFSKQERFIKKNEDCK